MSKRGRGTKKVATPKKRSSVSPFSSGKSVISASLYGYSGTDVLPTPFKPSFGMRGRGRGKRSAPGQKTGNPNEDVSSTSKKGMSNPNFSRTENKLIKCNDVVSFNEVPEKTKVKGVTVTTFNCVMKKNPITGTLEPAILTNLLRIIEKRGAGKIVVACIAWLSHPEIVAALSKCEQVLLLVTKEEYKSWGNGKCLALFAMLPRCRPVCHNFGHLATHLQCVEVTKSTGKFSEYAPVRTWGHGPYLEHNKWVIFMEKKWVGVEDLVSTDPERLNVLPHLKYLSLSGVLGQLTRILGLSSVYDLKEEDGAEFYFPSSYWTGSFNFTNLATGHHEGAEFIKNSELAWSKFQDFAATWMQSKPINGSAKSLNPTDHINKYNKTKQGLPDFTT